MSCNGCDTKWSGALICHCGTKGCHRTFTGLAAFDAHRSYGKCLDPATVLNQAGEPRLIQVNKPQWSGWSLAGGAKWWDK